MGTAFVADDAHDFWQPLEQSNAMSTQALRCAIWGAMPNNNGGGLPTCVSVCLNFPVSSMAVVVIELNGLPPLAQQGFTPVFLGQGGTSPLTMSVSPAVPVWAFTMVAGGDNLNSITGPGAPWTLLSQVSVNDPTAAGGLGDLSIVPAFAEVNAGALSATFTPSGGMVMIGATAGVLQTPAVVSNSNPNWPVIQAQAAFGAQPGNFQNPLTWTDITPRAIYDDSSAILDTTRGRSYELTGPESGTHTVWLNNSDGALTPGNAASPYYPNVLPQTPIRFLATWNNQVYPVAFGYIDKYPQTFDEGTPQFGMTNVSASDAMGVLANLTLYSALQSEILLDTPYSYWPFLESYGEASGLPFENLGNAISNTKPMIGVENAATGRYPLSTGLTLNLQGDTGSGIGVSGLTNTTLALTPGAICVDPGLPQPASGTPISVDFWASVPGLPQPSGGFITPLVTLLGSPTNFGSGGGPVRFQVAAVSGVSTYHTQVTVADFLGNSFTSSAFSLPNDGALHHHAFVWGAGAITHYLDGNPDTTVSTAVGSSSSDLFAVVVGPAIASPLTVKPYNYTLAHLAIYSGALPFTRVQAHYYAGATGFNLDTNTMRFKRIMAWSRAHVPMAATPASQTPLIGAAFSVGGQAPTDAFNDLLTSEGGWPYADAAGNVWWASRMWFYNKSPKWVFGDNPALGEIPYDPGQSFDFDNAYLYTQDEVTREIGRSSQITTSASQGVNALTFANTGAITRLNSPSAQAQYGNRNALSQTIITSTDQDVYDRGFWSLAKYSSASMRIPQIVVNAASNPALWPVALGAEVGDVVQVNRRPLGGAPYAVMGIIVKAQVQLNVAAKIGRATFGIVPYNIEANVIQVDVNGFDTPSSGLGW
jgi:hypothetical protein